MKKQILFFVLLQILCFYFVGAQKFFKNPEDSAYARQPGGLATYNTTPARNFQRTFIPLKPVQDSSQVVLTSLPEDVSIATEYMDYFGRPLQKVIKQASTTKNDYVIPFVYDMFGRISKQFLPYVQTTDNNSDGKFKSLALVKDSTFYHSLFPSDTYIYSEQKFEPSPLQRVVKETAAGQSWTGSGRGKTMSQRANSLSDSVRFWTINIISEDDIPTTSSVYPAGSLLVNEVTDEKGVRSVIYQDELGRTILVKTQLDSLPSMGHNGWLCTYYVYDEMNNVRMVLPPKAVDILNNSAGWNLASNSSITSGLCYSYWYDDENRPIIGQIPGKGKTYIAYDIYGRVVMTQDAGLRATNQWAFVQYDGQGRKTKIGLINYTLNKDSVIAQAARSASYPSLSGTYTITSQVYYDDYTWVSSSGTSLSSSLSTTDINSSNFFSSYNSSPEYAQSVTQSNRIRGMVTGVKKIIVGTSNYLFSLSIYDDHGRTIQIKQTNYSGGADVLTNQYSFSGQLLRSHLAHQKSGNNAQTHSLLTKYNYDHAGRIKNIVKNIDNTGDKTIVQNNFNELGQVQKKVLGASVDSMQYSYNLRGWLTGINKQYVTTSGSSSSFFGEAIYYDSSFTTAQYNGSISGVRWKSGGDGIARGYSFDYDNQNRLTKADYSQINQGASSWTKDKVDFTVDRLTYDAGGNITSMRQKGLIVNSIATIDSLTYEYFVNSNQLKKVNDAISNSSPLGDFKDTTYTGDDYAYDDNGNTTKDYNRKMYQGAGSNGAVYNYLNKPDSIVIAGRNTVYYYYDAAGHKLSKKVNDYTSGALVTKTYLYMNGFVYLNDTLQYVLQEEGRIRYAKKTNSQTGSVYYAYEYDYFLRDHLSNVRTVLTEGKDTLTYAASMEPVDSTHDKALFANEYDPVNTVYPKPTNFDTDNGNQYVARLNASSGINKRTGPSLVLKVMAGDKVQMNTFAFYNTATQQPSGPNLLNDLISALSSGVASSSSGKLVTGTALNDALSPGVLDFLNTNSSYNTSKPKAFLNWILFDEQFNYVSSNSGSVQVESGSSKQALVAPLQTISKSGYLYVYVSNESPQDVFFDDITIKHFTGPLLQEQSYYPFGLQMAGISSKALCKLSSQYKFNGGVELEEETGYYNTFYRQYDAQIGRFTGVDVLGEENHQLNVYQFGFDNPLLFNDPLGDNAAASNPPSFKNFTELLNYIQQNGVGAFPDNFTFYQLKADGKLDDPFVAGGLSQNKNGEWGVRLYGGGLGNNSYGGEGEMRELVLTTKWISLENFRVDWNKAVALNFLDKANSTMGGFMFGTEVTFGMLGKERIITKTHGSGAIELAEEFKYVGKVGNKLIKTVETIGFVGGIIDAGFAVRDAWNNPTAGNIAKAGLKILLASVKVNPVVNLVTTIADVTGVTDWLFDW